jgi:hypothetical protein
MAEISTSLVDEENFGEIPAPSQPGARCQTCDYWERLEGGRAAPEADATDASAREARKLDWLLAGRRLTGAYGMLAHLTDAVERTPVGYAQFGPISAYARAQVIRDRYPDLPDSPAPWVITCLQVDPMRSGPEREAVAVALLRAVCDELDRRGVGAVEAYPEGAIEPWQPSPGPAATYAAADFDHIAGDDRFPVYRRELTGEADAETWGRLLRRGEPDDSDDWPLPMPKTPDLDDFFRLPPERPKRPNPFGDD